mmetsp:Transcript_23276/g.52846  ORF Transcript_23276/g.52846 Transcript_23276/m.52846 type:complete len:216 (-) Transcript_23276:168-815(-)
MPAAAARNFAQSGWERRSSLVCGASTPSGVQSCVAKNSECVELIPSQTFSTHARSEPLAVMKRAGDRGDGPTSPVLDVHGVPGVSRLTSSSGAAAAGGAGASFRRKSRKKTTPPELMLIAALEARLMCIGLEGCARQSSCHGNEDSSITGCHSRTPASTARMGARRPLILRSVGAASGAPPVSVSDRDPSASGQISASMSSSAEPSPSRINSRRR